MKKQLKLFSLLALTIFGTLAVASRLFFSVASATYVEGPIEKDTVWTLTDSPFVVINDVIIKPNAMLTVEPGVKISFGGNFSLTVEGRLTAVGTQDDKITFTSEKHQPQEGDWNTILFVNRTQPSTMEYCIVKYAINGITVGNGNVQIKNSEISENSQNGINILYGEAKVEKSEIADNLAAGISVAGDCQVTIQNNTLRANEDGILLTGSSTSGVDIRQNVVLLNTQSGIHLGADAYNNLVILNNTVSANNDGFYVSGNANTIITNNSISYNSVGIFYEGGEDHEAHFNDIYGNDHGMDLVPETIVNATYNYWGDESGPYHISLNPDGKGNSVGGDGVNLDFIFFLTSPISYINHRPTANLLSDTKVVRPNQTVIFFATTSSDDKRVDQYYFNFGDSQNSSWTTLSVFTHKYSLIGTYYATVMVMDDFGVKSNNEAIVRIDVRDLPSLTVSLTTSSTTVGSGEQLSITVYATAGASPMAGANVTLFSIVGGSLTPSSGLTNSSGYFTALFTAPNETEKAYVRITATVSKTNYADGSDYKYVSVLPILSVYIIADTNVIKSEATLNGTVLVTHNANPVEGVAVTLSSDGGSFSQVNGSTDAYGDFGFTFRAPQTLTQLNVTITATATKSDYWNGVAQTKITVDPKALAVQITASPATVESRAAANVVVHVTSDEIPVAGAAVSLSSDTGSLSVATGNTDANGDFIFVFTAPETTTQVNATITASTTKSGYVDGEEQAKITVNPIPGSEPGGLPLTTLLLIAIPIAVVAIVAVLIKARVIVITREQE